MRIATFLKKWVVLSFLVVFSVDVIADVVEGPLELVGQKRVSRFDYEYTYKLTATNDGGDILNVAATVTSSSANTIILDGTLSFGDMNAGASAQSSDTFSIRHNRRFPLGNALNFAFTFEEDDPPPPPPGDEVTIVIESPASLLTVGSSPITVSGSVTPDDAKVTLNGVEVSNNAGSFSGDVALNEGLNAIEARATKGESIVSDIVSISLDLTPPFLTVDSHEDGQTVFTDKVTITGLINDIVRGTIEEDEANVTVNGVDGIISNRSYSAADIPLLEGENVIPIIGSDQVGNTEQIDLNLIYEIPLGKRVELVSGQNQSAIINEEVQDPLKVQVLDDNGDPVVGAAVVFRVTQGSGAVGVGSDEEGRAVVDESDASGMASTKFKVGARTGTANHKVKAAVVGYESEVIFNASATGQIGNKLSVNSGNNQRGSVGQVLPEPFVVVVTDAGANVVKDSRVRFDVTKGEGHFVENEQESYETITDSDGRATAQYILGEIEGLDAQRVVATLLDGPTGQTITAGFSATAFVPSAFADTTISGVVLDNQDNPIPGVTIRVDGTSREDQTDDEGQFLITESPVGPVHLVADGSTASVEGEFPSLSYNLVTIAGVDNPLSAPIYMVKLDTEQAVYVGPEDASLTLDEFPGFQLDVFSDSVTFPDGAREGYLSVTPVNASKVPMAPPNGMQPQFIVTIQPTGTRFDPPARLTLPNVDAHAPGAKVEMYSFDHDLEEFVSIGLGTVSEDGILVTSDPGVGVIKAGWHCGSQPGGQSCAHNCPICQDCDGDCNCVPASGDPRLAGLNSPGDCKKTECENGSTKVVNDDSDEPADPTDGDCKKLGCENGTAKEVADLSDDSKCLQCTVDGPIPKPDGHVPDDDKCIICQDGKETKKPDKNETSVTITFNGVKNFIANVNEVLAWVGSDKSIPEVGLEYSHATKDVCCTQANGAYKKETKDEGAITFEKWSASWTPTIPPWSGDYTFTVLGKKIGVAYGIRFTADFGGKVKINRTKRECTNDNCWGGDVEATLGLGGGPFGSVPNPASSPVECGPPGDKRPCDLIRLQGTIKTGVNVQAGVNCDKISGSIGHSGVTVNAEIIVAEGSWLETGGSKSWVLVSSGVIVPVINIAMPN